MSPIVSYQYTENFGSAALTNGGILSPIASYQYFEWPDVDGVGFRNSALVSYFYGLGEGAALITAQPQPLSVQAGMAANFNVVADGRLPLQYQWLYQGHPISGPPLRVSRSLASSLVAAEIIPLRCKTPWVRR